MVCKLRLDIHQSRVKESRGASVLLKISEDPFITTFKARLMCAQHNIEPNF